MKHFAYLVASLALLIGTTAAIAGTHPDNRTTHGPGAITLDQQTGVVRPDDHATHGPGAASIWRSNEIVRPDDRATHGQGAIVIEPVTARGQVPVIRPAGPRADGFDWLDAGIGAAAALGLGLIVAGGVVFALRRDHAPAYS
jgi:hypothetical protein